MKFTVTVTIDHDEDGTWIVECPAIPGCISQGKTKREAIENIKDAIKLCLEVRAERGMPLTVESRQAEVTPALELSEIKIDIEKRRSLRQAARGMWRDRDDLPELSVLRGEMNRIPVLVQRSLPYQKS